MREIRIVTALCVLALSGVTAACAQTSDAQKLAALAAALKNGVLTQQEYNAKVGQIKGSGVDPKRKAALDDALKNGLLTQQEYDAKLQALKGGGGAPQPAASAPASGGEMSSTPVTTSAISTRGSKKTVTVVDTMFHNMPAMTVTVPADWTFDGAILRPSCGDSVPFLVFRAYSPDKLTGVQWIPRADWYSAADTRAYQMAGVAPCNLHAPAHAADVIGSIASGLRPGSQVVTQAPQVAEDAAAFQAGIEKMNQRLLAASQSTPGFLTKFSGDGQRIRVRYDFEGHPVEEWLQVTVTVADQPITVIGTGPNGIIQPGVARLMHSIINVNTARAPAGKLEASEAALREIMKSVKMIPEYDDAMIAFMKGQNEIVLENIRKSGQQVLESGAEFGRAMQQRNDQYHAWQNDERNRSAQKFTQDMQRKDSQAANFLDYVKDQTYYVNPSTGGTVTIKNQVGVSGYVGQNPSGNWTQLVPVSH